VRCVRSKPTPGASIAQPRFVRFESSVLGEYLVTDTKTSLMWQGCTSGLSGSACGGTATRRSWRASLTYCEDFNWGGHLDWRLPSVMELRSIADERISNPSIDLTAFPATASTRFWSSSSTAEDPSRAWLVNFFSGTVFHLSKGSSSEHVRCVRDEP